MEIFKGTSAFAGIAIGKILYYHRGEYQIRQSMVDNVKKEAGSSGPCENISQRTDTAHVQEWLPASQGAGADTETSAQAPWRRQFFSGQWRA